MYILSLLINLLIVISLYVDPYYQDFSYIMMFGYGLSLFGFVYQVQRSKVMAYMAIAGFVFFIPIGILGMIGIRRSMDAHQKATFLKEQGYE